jgi:hypothetical protein
MPQWFQGRSLAGHSCGGSRGFTPRSDLVPCGNLARPPDHTRNETRVNQRADLGRYDVGPDFTLRALMKLNIRSPSVATQVPLAMVGRADLRFRA